MASRSGAKRGGGAGVLGFSLLALLFTGSTAFFLAKALKGPQFSAQSTRKVLIAARDLRASSTLARDDFKLVEVPVVAIPEGAMKGFDQLFPEGSITAPQVLTSKAYRGEVILKQHLSDSKQGTGFASLIGAEMRAFPLIVDSEATRANLVYPGASIDVLVTIQRPESRDVITKLAVQNVKVLAVNGLTEPEELRDQVSARKKSNRGKRDVLTLAVNPDQGERLALATREGKVDVLLRNVNDPLLIDTNGVTLSELTKSDLEEEAPSAPETQKPKRSGRAQRTRYRVRRNQSRSSSSTQSGRRSGAAQTLELP